jgi:hypothetical protein
LQPADAYILDCERISLALLTAILRRAAHFSGTRPKRPHAGSN